MKKFRFLFSVLLLAVLMFTGCSKNSPKDVAQAWLNSFWNLDAETAKKLSTEDTKRLLSELEELTSRKVSDSDRKKMKKITVTIKLVNEHGDKAIVTYRTSDVPDKDQDLNLIKQNDKWLVQFSKNDLMGGAAIDTSATPPAAAESDDTTAPAANAAQDDTLQ